MISNTKLKKKILSDKYNSIIFDKGRRRDVYLIGGYVRDLIRGYHSQDRDYIISGNVMSIVKEVKDCIGGTIVTFKKGGTIRIATKNGVTFDFTRLIGSLNEDISKRDFTINTIAWSPHEGIIDIFNGIDDIQNRVVRVIRKENFIDDPIRMLRAYRFAAELDGIVEKGTRQLIKILNNNIKETSFERITLEIFQLLNQNHSAKHLKNSLSDDILSNIFSITSKVLDKNIKQISLFEKDTMNQLQATFKVKLKEIISQNLTYKGLLCLALLTKSILNEKEISYKLKMSGKIMRRIKLIQASIDERLENSKSFDIYMKAKEASIDLLILKDRLDCLSDYKRFLRIWNSGIIGSEEVIEYSENISGKNIGFMIKEIKKAQYEGKVRDKSSAIEFIRKLSGTLYDM